MDKRVENLEKTVYGNGKPGIAYEMVEIKTVLNGMNEKLGSLSTSISALAKAQAETDTSDRVKRLEDREVEINKAVDYVKKCSSPAYQIGQLLITIGSVTTIIAGILYFLP